MNLITNINELVEGQEVCLLFAYQFANGVVTRIHDHKGQPAADIECPGAFNPARMETWTAFNNPRPEYGYPLSILGGWSCRGFVNQHVTTEQYNEQVLRLPGA